MMISKSINPVVDFMPCAVNALPVSNAAVVSSAVVLDQSTAMDCPPELVACHQRERYAPKLDNNFEKLQPYS